MRMTTTDPMTLNDVTDLKRSPFIIEGEDVNAIKIYFESKQNFDDFLIWKCMA